MPNLHLVRHGEVHNPNHVVYGDLPGFNLSTRGVLQAHAAGRHLADAPVGMVITSPLARAFQTASAIASHHGLTPVRVGRLVESRQYPGWTGLRWDDVHERFADQIGRYLSDATALHDVEESVGGIARRYSAAIDGALDETSGDLVVVGHQDPIHATALHLVGSSLSTLRTNPPEHASVTTLDGQTDGSWERVSYWAPPQA